MCGGVAFRLTIYMHFLKLFVFVYSRQLENMSQHWSVHEHTWRNEVKLPCLFGMDVWNELGVVPTFLCRWNGSSGWRSLPVSTTSRTHHVPKLVNLGKLHGICRTSPAKTRRVSLTRRTCSMKWKLFLSAADKEASDLEWCTHESGFTSYNPKTSSCMVCMMHLHAFKFLSKELMGGPEISQCFIQRWKGREWIFAVGLDRWWRTQRFHGFQLQVSWFCIKMWDLFDEVLVKVYQIPVAYQVSFPSEEV